MKHMENNTLNSFEKKAKEVAVFEEEMSEFRINSEDTVTMLCVDYLKGHRSGTINRILSSTSWTKTTMTAEWNELKSTAFTTTVHCTTKRRVTTVNHAINVFNDRFAGV